MNPRRREVRVFESLHDADADDVAFYSSMDPQERLDLVVELSRQVFGEPDEAVERRPRVYRVVELELR